MNILLSSYDCNRKSYQNTNTFSFYGNDIKAYDLNFKWNAFHRVK